VKGPSFREGMIAIAIAIAIPVLTTPHYTPIKQDEGTLKKVFFQLTVIFKQKRFSMIEILEVRLLF